MVEEIWKDVPRYEGYYQVSNLGRVKSLQRTTRCDIKNTIKRNRVSKEKIMKPFVSRTGYEVVDFRVDGKREKIQVHQLVAMAFLGHERCGYEKVINHINFIRADNRLENLEIVSMRENGNQKHIPSSSSYVGVYKNKSNKWAAHISILRKLRYIGAFCDENDAHLAYQNALEQWENHGKIPELKQYSSKYKGVSLYKDGRWQANFTANGEGVFVGYFKDEYEAHLARESAKEIWLRDGALPVKKERVSKYKGVFPNLSRWVSAIVLNGKRIHIGYHDSEEVAAETFNRVDNVLNSSGVDAALAEIDKIKLEKAMTRTSIHKGIAKIKDEDRWHAYCTINGKRKNVGYFKTEEEAYEKLTEFKKHNNLHN